MQPRLSTVQPGIYRYMIAFLLLTLFSTTIVSAADFRMPVHLGPKDYDRDAIRAFVNSGEQGTLGAFKGDSSLRASRLQMSFYMKSD